ncbi:hypothetical protein JB92DRAFT_2835883 [Gautieria morchelliformis]|nr:hypothetical protein JB92DRAFT_2835883 [Gautieria morchelliformis]
MNVLSKIVSSRQSDKDNAGKDDGTPVSDTRHRFKYPDLKSGLTDHITAHMKGNKFDYVTISKAPKVSRNAMLQALREFKPYSREKIGQIDLDDIPPIDLVKEKEEFVLSAALNTKGLNKYILIDSVYVDFVPLSSFLDSFSEIRISLIDGRKAHDKVVRSYVGNSNISEKIMGGLDYCFPTKSLGKIKFVISCRGTDIEQGEEWGVIKVKIDIQHLVYPKQVPVKDTVGILDMAYTAFEDLKTDPRHFNTLVDQKDLDALKIMHRDNDIVDQSKPIEELSKPVTYAGTRFLGGGAQGSDNASIIDDIPSASSKEDDEDSKIKKWVNKVEPDDEIKDVAAPKKNTLFIKVNGNKSPFKKSTRFSDDK